LRFEPGFIEAIERHACSMGAEAFDEQPRQLTLLAA
jgi:hypothetical protein